MTDGHDELDEATAQRVRDQVRAALADDSPDLRIPDDVAARLHARLAVETAPPTDEAVAPVTTLPVGARRPIPTRWYAAAAGVVLVAIGTTVALTQNHHPTKAATTASEASGSLVPNEKKARSLPRDRVTHSGVVLATAADLDRHTQDLVSGAGTTASSGDAGAPAAVAAPQQQGPVPAAPTQASIEKTVAGGLTACLASLDDSKVPIAVDEVTYQGKDSLLVLFPGEKAKQVDVFVIGPACGAAPPDGVRDFRTVTIS